MTKRKKSIHYVNNKEFLAALIQYKKEIKEAQERGDPKPRITNYLGECFLKIATHLSDLMKSFLTIILLTVRTIAIIIQLRTAYTQN